MLPTAQMDQIAAAFQGRLGFYVEDVNTGEAHHYNADQRFPTASICKVPVMIELFRQVDGGRLSLDERRRLDQNIAYHGTGVLQLLQDEPELTLRDYCRLMMSVSDNMATDMIIEAVGLESVNPTIEAMGFLNTRTNMTLTGWRYLVAGMAEQPVTRRNNELMHKKLLTDGPDYDGPAFTDSLRNNVTTPGEMGGILKQLHLGGVVSSSASAAMIEMLKGCTDRRMIPFHIRPEVPIGHKIGSSSRIKGDVGIAYLPTGPLIISVLTLGSDASARGEDAIAQISRLAVKALSPESVDG